jgi:hypothetical protein
MENKITNLICSDFTIDDWIKFAGIIDANFYATERTFTADRKKGYYYLNTNICDDCSIVRVYCQIGVSGIEKIERLGSDTESWQEIQPSTYGKLQRLTN